MPPAGEERTFRVEMLTRVEGEGAFTLTVREGRVTAARLAIFEAPRFFEALLRGRSMMETPDITARICGICPVAYQMSAARAVERALGLAVPDDLTRLRRLLYCGEWIESHALHLFLLHLPDFLGYPGAVEMAAARRDLVERGLRLKKAGNRVIETLGGRAIHPVSVRVGGFTKTPAATDLHALLPDLERGLQEAEETVEFVAALPTPRLDRDYTFVSLDAGAAYPLERGEGVRISGRGVVPVDDFLDQIVETQVPHSNALHARLNDGTPYLCGPLARLSQSAAALHPRAARALERGRLKLPARNPYQSIVARAVELTHAFAEAADIVRAYAPPARPFVAAPPREAVGHGATEAPRGLLVHRYQIGADGLVREARIVPPTSQNQATIEADLVALAPDILAMDHAAATARCEQLIRSYDPCISCATHFLTLTIDRGERRVAP